MSQDLRQSTSIKVRLGPAMAVDGVTPVTTLTIGSADQAEILKANGAATVAMTGTLAAVSGADGWYDYTVAVGDVDTLGTIDIVIQDTSLNLPVFKSFMVMPAAAFDTLYGTTLITPEDVGQLYESTIATRTSDTDWLMTTNIVSNDAWIGQVCTVQKADGSQIWSTWVTDVVASTNQILTAAAPNGTNTIPFTVAANDVVRIESRMHAMYALNKYDPPTRTEATGDQATILAKLLAYVQVLARSDADIATFLSVELGDVNNDLGSGVGTYSPPTDSLEANQVAVAAIDTAPMRGTDGANTTAPNTVAPDNAGIANIQSRLPATLVNDSIKANVARVNNVAVTGDGESGTEWNPV